jgi:hypothetical protein
VPAVRRCVLALVLLVGCYSPNAPQGAPCSDAHGCPSDQSCIAGFCARPDDGTGMGSNMEPDGGPPTMTDRDGDGVPNERDNCPDNANPDQYNEDGDAFGDVCDLCPTVATTSTTDSDGDKIGDACDPNPATKDTVWLFEGFHRGLPQWTYSTHWTVAGDVVTVAAPGGSNDVEDFIDVPLSATGRTFDNFTFSTSVTAKALTGNIDHEVAISVYDGNTDNELDCGLADGPNGNDAVLYVADLKQLRNSKPLAWTINQTYTLTAKRTGSTYTCTAVGPTGTLSVSGSSPAVPRNGAAFSVWMFGATFQLNWIDVTGP